MIQNNILSWLGTLWSNFSILRFSFFFLRFRIISKSVDKNWDKLLFYISRCFPLRRIVYGLIQLIFMRPIFLTIFVRVLTCILKSESHFFFFFLFLGRDQASNSSVFLSEVAIMEDFSKSMETRTTPARSVSPQPCRIQVTRADGSDEGKISLRSCSSVRQSMKFSSKRKLCSWDWDLPGTTTTRRTFFFSPDQFLRSHLLLSQLLQTATKYKMRRRWNGITSFWRTIVATGAYVVAHMP